MQANFPRKLVVPSSEHALRIQFPHQPKCTRKSAWWDHRPKSRPVAGAKGLDLGRDAWLTRPDLDEGLNLGRFVWLARPVLDLGLSPTDDSAVYRKALPNRYTLLYKTQKLRYLKFRRASEAQDIIMSWTWCPLRLNRGSCRHPLHLPLWCGTYVATIAGSTFVMSIFKSRNGIVPIFSTYCFEWRMRVWPTPGYNDTSFRIQIHALKKSGNTSLELCLAFAFKSRGKRRIWWTIWCSSAIGITLAQHVRAEGLPNSLLSHYPRSAQRIWPQKCLRQPSRVVYKEGL